MTSSPPPHPAAGAPRPWHLARSLQSLLNEVNAHWPARSKASDGGIGDARHAAEAEASDHNPWLSSSLGPAVRAFDFTAAGINAPWLAEQLRLAGQAGDHRLTGGGYVIFDHHITAEDWSHWTPYSGDPHTSHVHVSVSRDPAGFEDAGPWPFLATPEHPAGPTQAPAPAGHPAVEVGPHAGNGAHHAPAPLLDPDGPEAGFPSPGADAAGAGASLRAQRGNRGPRVAMLRHQLSQVFPDYADLVDGEDYDGELQAVVEDFQRRAAHDTQLQAGTRSALSQGNGDTVGPATAAALVHYGIHL